MYPRTQYLDDLNGSFLSEAKQGLSQSKKSLHVERLFSLGETLLWHSQNPAWSFALPRAQGLGVCWQCQ